MENIDISLLILPEIKEIYKDEDANITCVYEGCGADDGWPKNCLM